MKILLICFGITLLMYSCGATLSLQDKLIAEHPEWLAEHIVLIRKNEIANEMTIDMVKAAWGEPSYINKSSNIYNGETITWTYSKLFSGELKAVSFQNGKVTMYSAGALNQ